MRTLTTMAQIGGRVLWRDALVRKSMTAQVRWLGLGKGSRSRQDEEEGRNVVKSRYPDIELSDRSYFDFVWSKAAQYGNLTALVDAVTERSLTYVESRQLSLNVGAELRRRGARRGDVMALLLPNCIEYPLLFSGAAAAGVSLTTLNPIYTAPEIAKQLKLAKAGWAVTTQELLPRLKEAMEKLPSGSKLEVFIVGENSSDCASVDELFSVQGKDSDLDLSAINVDEDICVLPFSSGTTGVPKGVMLTHRNIVGNICQVVDCPPEMQLIKHAKDGYQSVTVCVLPLYHAFAMNVTMGPILYGGGKMVVAPKFEPKLFVSALEKHKPTFLHLAPPLVSFLANHPSVTPSHLSSLEHIVAAAAPSGPALIQSFKEKAGEKVLYREGWGMSETSPIVLMTPLGQAKLSSCGILVPNASAKIVDLNTGKNLGKNERGELCVKGPQNMKGYFNNPEATANTVDSDGWLHTGDIAVCDEDDYFYIVDRLKELIKVKGFQVPPAELEDLLRGHDDVQDVAVIGIPHEKFGEAPRAYIVKSKDSNATEEDICKFVADNAAPYKQLAGGVEFMEVIPKSAAGKILRKELVAKFERDNS